MREELQEDAFRFPEKGAGSEQVALQRRRLLEKIDASDHARSRTRRMVLWASGTAAAMLIFAFVQFFAVERTEAIRAGLGEKLEKVLPDGSLIILNSDTRISYPRDIATGKSREVWISGEAFFRVARTPSAAPFTVHTPHFDVVVTGTQFNLNSEHDRTGILLTEGTVTIITPDGKRRNMKPGEYFSKGDDTSGAEGEAGKEAGIQPGKPDMVLSWLEKHLVFENTPLTEVALEIERRYKVKVVMAAGQAGTRTITGILPNDNLDVLLRTLAATTDLRIRKEDNQIIIEESK